MKKLLCAIVALLLLASGLNADTSKKVTINAKNLPIGDTLKQLNVQTGCDFIVDPKAKTNVTLSLTDVDLPQALDAITNTNNLIWKKISFANSDDDKPKLEQMESTIIAMSSMPMVAICVEDPATKKTVMYAKDMPSTPDKSVVPLPQNYTWKTVYVIFAKDSLVKKEEDKKDAVTAMCEAQGKLTAEMAKMTSEQRQQVYADEIESMCNYSPEVRQQMMKDRMDAFHNLDQSTKDQLRQDMHSMFGEMHGRSQN